MRRPTQRRLGLLALALLVSATLGAVSLPAAAEPEADGDPVTWRAFGAAFDDPGHVSRISTNENRLYTGEADGFYAYRPDGRDIEIGASRGGEGWLPFSVDLRPPDDGVLTEGSYELTKNQNEAWGPSRRVDTIHGRCSALGSFEIRELDPDLAHLWVFYRYPCSEGRAQPTIEIRLNMPEAAGPLETMPSAVDYQLTPSGTFVKPTAVTIMNRSPRLVRVRDVDVAGAPSWVRRWSTCEVVAPGGFCRVWVRFVATAPGYHDGVLALDTDAGSVEVPLRGFAGPADPDTPVRRPSAEGDAPPQPDPESAGSPRTALLLQSEKDEPIGRGRAQAFTNADVGGIGGSDGRYRIDVTTSRHYYNAFFYTPTTESMLPGTDVRVRYGTDDFSQLDVSGDHRGCGSSEGRYRVRQAEFDLFGVLTRVLVTFAQNCQGSRARLHGTVAWNALGPIPKPPGYPRTPGLGARFSTAPTGVTTVEGRLSVSGSRRVREVLVERRIPERRRWEGVVSLRTDRAGRFSRRFRVDEGSRVRVRFDGGPYLAPRSTPSQLIRR